MVVEEKRREEKKWILLLSVDYGSEEVKHVSFEEDRTEDTARGDWGQQTACEVSVFLDRFQCLHVLSKR